jgi:hypothetical protein
MLHGFTAFGRIDVRNANRVLAFPQNAVCWFDQYQPEEAASALCATD